MRYYWRVRAWLPERFRQRCRVLLRGRMNSCLVEFEDGYRVVTSRNRRSWNVSTFGIAGRFTARRFLVVVRS
jgi:hypothetical protein